MKIIPRITEQPKYDLFLISEWLLFLDSGLDLTHPHLPCLLFPRDSLIHLATYTL